MEIYQIPAEKTFKGIAMFKMVVISPQKKENGTIFYSSPLMSSEVFGKNGQVLMQQDLENADGVRLFVRDPGVQQKILNCAADALRAHWSNKVLNKTWHETKDMFLVSYKDRLDSFLDSLRFDLYVSYKITLSDKPPASLETFNYEAYPTSVNTEPEAVKSFLIHELIDETMMQEIKDIFARGLEVLVDKEMKPFMEDEVTRRENDIQMLKILTKRYPNYSELIDKQETV